MISGEREQLRQSVESVAIDIAEMEKGILAQATSSSVVL